MTSTYMRVGEKFGLVLSLVLIEAIGIILVISGMTLDISEFLYAGIGLSVVIPFTYFLYDVKKVVKK